ncbi:GAF domain-containing protein [Magnetovibrio sp.]|uniref:GAF domain-containing protein n=1 Tax=Magnetovibrio sp. TaxID=2024836 RepID=UPI002F9357C3
MNDPKTSPTTVEHRQWERQEYRTGMILVLDGERIFEGQTLNVSPGGVFLSIASPFTDIKSGEKAELRISPYPGSPYFSCTVCRIGDNGVGLEFASDQAGFGAYISHDMLLNLTGKINNALANSLDLKTTIDTCVDQIRTHLQAEGSSLFLVNDDKSTVVCSACSGPVDISGLEVSIDEGIVGRAVRDRTPQTVHNVSTDPFFTKAVDQKTGFQTVSLLCAPMIIQGEVIGALEVVNKRGTGFFTESDEVTLMALASSAALALNNARQATNLIEKEARIRASDMNYQFLSALNHKLHTPLNSVLGYAQLLEMDKYLMASSLGKDAVPQIIAAGQNLMDVVDAILAFAELESGKINVSTSPLPPFDIYEASLETAQTIAAPRNIRIIDQSEDPASLPMIEVDDIRFKQVMDNVLGFAICGCADGDTVTLSHTIADGMVRFEVGFHNPCPDIPNVSVPFAPKTNCGEPEMTGSTCTGLELAISSKLVKLMNGQMDLERKEGTLINVWFAFPIADGV